ncbi:sugar (pentulose or hexulose) kinase [Lachnospiraceae bacterium PM6-15]|uniref:xylulokinase n=1 Tax=Ohessyouella blattaphilus TaxID=2949333 RepID=UPI003E270ABB
MSEVLKAAIENGNTSLGIEFGSTRIKAVLIEASGEVLATGGYDWENQLVDGIWTYDLKTVQEGLQASYLQMATDVKEKYGIELTKIGSIGISAMMHGYIPFNDQDELLVPFRTWRNTMTEPASAVLSKLFNFHIPQRWSVAHLYQAILNQESHVKDVDFFTTLAGYVHWQLTGEKVLGIGDASGMFPIDSKICDYDETMVSDFNSLAKESGYSWKVEELMPKVLVAGEDAGKLTEAGAKLLDPTGKLTAGIPLCPPEGDAGTGMAATNAVAVRTGNVSAGTSVFAMVVLEKALSRAYEEIDLVTTPSGEAVAMVHCNNGTSDLNAWVNLFKEFAESFGIEVDMNKLFGTLYNKALEGDDDLGGLLAYNYFSGEHITEFEAGRPLFVKKPDSKFNLANFMKTHLFTSLGALKTGMDILLKNEGVKLEVMMGHGGFFKTPVVGQRIMAGAINTPVALMETAGEGGAWGIAILASYLINKEAGESLADYLGEKVFAGEKGDILAPETRDVKAFDDFLERYTEGLAIERAAVDSLR